MRKKRMRFLKIGDAAKELGICPQTIRNWVDKDKIPHRKTPGGHRIIDIDAYLAGKELLEKEKQIPRRKIFYCRVSSNRQKDDLERQTKLAEEKYPEHEIIQDIGSGINWKRKGFLSLLEGISNRTIEEIVVFHRDRLARFGFELIENLCRINKVHLLVHSQGEDTSKSAEKELVDDLMAIVTVFSCRQMGKRRYTRKNISIEINPDISE